VPARTRLIDGRVLLCRMAPDRGVFPDHVLEKTLEDGTRELLHMVFLVYTCRPASTDIVLNEEFSEFLWADAYALAALELSPLTRDTLTSAGLLKAGRAKE
jgi:hypothetical protein